MKMNNVMIVALILLVVIIIGLFIELRYKKKHAHLIVLAPSDIIVIKGKELGEKDNIVIFNTSKVTTEEALAKIAKTKRNRYKVVPIHNHVANKIRKPFDDSYREYKEGYAEASPMSFMYKTAVSIVDVAHELTSSSSTETQYKMLVPKDTNHVAFFDDDNVYIK